MDMITIGDFAGFFASIIATCSMLPQLIKTVRTRSTEGLSLMTLTLSFLGNLGWLINGLAYDSMALVFSGICLMAMIAPIIFIKVKNEMKMQDCLNISSQ